MKTLVSDTPAIISQEKPSPSPLVQSEGLIDKRPPKEIALELRARGLSIRRIARRLFELGHKSRTGKMLGTRTVLLMLTDKPDTQAIGAGTKQIIKLILQSSEFSAELKNRLISLIVSEPQPTKG